MGGALIVLGYTLAYQALENVWLSPRLSAETMDLSGLVAFGAAIAGGALAGPVGAFIALPTAALATAMVREYGRSYDVVYVPENADIDPPSSASGFGPDGVVRDANPA